MVIFMLLVCVSAVGSEIKQNEWIEVNEQSICFKKESNGQVKYVEMKDRKRNK